MTQTTGATDDWEESTIGEAGTVITGNTPPTSDKKLYGGSVPFIKPSHLIDRPVNQTEQSISVRGRNVAKIVPAQTVLVSCIGNLGKTGITVMESAFNQQINAVVFGERVQPRFGFYQCQTLRPYLERVSSATTIAIVNKSKFSSAPFRIPPIEEQRQIVAKIDELFSDLDAGVAALERARANLKRYRAAVLKAAVEGKLTEQWRAEHPDVEPASTLLERILAERRAKWEEEQFRKYEAKGKKPPKRWREKYKEPARTVPRAGVALPDGWEWVTVDQILTRIETGKSYKCLTRPATLDEWGIIKVSAMSWGTFGEAENKAVPDDSRLNPNYEIRRGDILLSRANTVDLVGASVLVGDCRTRLLLSDKSLRLVPGPEVDRAWFQLTLSSPAVRAQLSNVATGTSDSMRNVSQEKLRLSVVPLPPLDEQREIVQAVESLYSVIDANVVVMEKASVRANRLRQSILDAAFRGRLIPSNVAEVAAPPLESIEVGA